MCSSDLINSFHLVCGALVLTTSLVLALRSWRVKFARAVPVMPASRPAPRGVVVADRGARA